MTAVLEKKNALFEARQNLGKIIEAKFAFNTVSG